MRKLGLSPLSVKIGHPMRWLLAVLSLIVLMGAGSFAHRVWGQGKIAGGEVRGYVAAHFRGLAEEEASLGIRLPNATVSLKDLMTGQFGPKAATNYHGNFRLPPHPPGRYQVCVEAPGFISSCEPTPISVGSGTVVSIREVRIAPAPGVLRGRVLLADGSSCYHEGNFLGPTTVAKVRLVDIAGADAGVAVVANSGGQYVLPRVVGPGSFTIRATCAEAEASRAVAVGPSDLLGLNAFDLTLPNAPPKVASLTIKNAAGVLVRWASPGEVVEVTVQAHDPDGDALHYRWGDGSPGFVSVDSPTIKWPLAGVPAVNALFVEITDRKGGFVIGRVSIATGPPRALFTGRVSESAGMPMAGVTVNVNGSAATTDAQGNFWLELGENQRYVVTVKKPGYALLSRVFYSGASQLDLRLDRTQRRLCIPTTRCTLREEGRRTRAAVTIEPNSVVDVKGNLVKAPFFVDIYGYDVARPNPIPGDFSGFDRRGRPVALTMSPYGALHVEVTDGGGNPLKLRPGAQARVDLQVEPSRLASAPPRIPFLSYDETTASWKEKGQATRVGDRYEARVGHFSALCIACPHYPSFLSACIKVQVRDLDQMHRRPTFPFTLRVLGDGFQFYVPVSGEFTLVPNLPANSDVTLMLYPTMGVDPNPLLDDPNAVLGPQYDVNSGGPINQASNPWPYNACKGQVILTVQVPQPSRPFLSYPYDADQDPEGTSNAYYQKLGAYNDMNTQTFDFCDWKKKNGFSSNLGDCTKPGDQPAPDEYVAVYYNNRDLQVGQDVHCSGTSLACYVTTYPGSPCADFRCPAHDAIRDAIKHDNPSVTLAMEYSPFSQNGPRIVKFYAFEPGGKFDPGGKLVTKVNLDSEGLKYLPHVCVSCHYAQKDFGADPNKGHYNPDFPDLAATFLPFDPPSFRYSTQMGKTLIDQRGSLTALNLIVYLTNPNIQNTNDPIRKFIANVTPICFFGPCPPPNDDYVPPGWPNAADPNKISPTNPGGVAALYRTIVRPYCQSCHLAQTIDFTKFERNYWQHDPNNPAEPTYTETAVCSETFMPHAEGPYLAFWINPKAFEYLASPKTGVGFTKCKHP